MFKFPLQRILELRARREEEVARQLVAARSAAESVREHRDSLRAVHQAGQDHIADTQERTPTVGEIQSLAYVLGQLDQRLEAAQLDAAAADAAVDQVHRELTSAWQDRQMLDRLRARRLEAHRVTESMKDRGAMDAIALERHTRPTDSTNKDGKHT